MEGSAGESVRIISRRMVRPTYGAMPVPSSSEEDIHLRPVDLMFLNQGYLQKGILLPKPKPGVGCLIDTLASSLSCALGRYYHFAGRLALEEHSDGTVTIPLRCSGDGAELVEAAAPGVAVADVVCLAQSPVVRAFFPLNGVYCGDAAMDSSLPVLAAQVTALADGAVFVAVSMNHIVGDGTGLWELFNAWSAVHRGDQLPSAPSPVHQRGFVGTTPAAIPLPSGKLREHVEQRTESPLPVEDGFFTFSGTSVRKLKKKANDEKPAAVAAAEATISSLQAVLAHLWRGVARARRLPRAQETSFNLIIGLRGRMPDIPEGVVGNAVGMVMATGCTAGEVLDAGLGWTAWQLNRAVNSFDVAGMRGWLESWAREPMLYPQVAVDGPGTLLMGSSPRFDVFGNDFGWGKPMGVWSGPGEKKDGKVSVFQADEEQYGEGSISLEVSLAPQTMERLLADHEFMEEAVGV